MFLIVRYFLNFESNFWVKYWTSLLVSKPLATRSELEVERPPYMKDTESYLSNVVPKEIKKTCNFKKIQNYCLQIQIIGSCYTQVIRITS